MALSHVVVASEPFAGRFAPGRTPREAVSAILARGARWAAVTLGERGAVAGDGRRWAEQPAFRVPVVDTTGAGDVYHGAVAVGLLDGAAPDDILRFAAAAAALKCRALGGRLGIPGRAEVEAFLKSGGEGSGKSASSRPAGRPGGCAKEGTEGI